MVSSFAISSAATLFAGPGLFSFPTAQITTDGWFLSRRTSSRACWAQAAKCAGSSAGVQPADISSITYIPISSHRL